MSVTTLSQLQFAMTSVYHFFFVPLTIGLSILVAIMETFYVRTGREIYKKMTKFWGKLFLINFAMGVVTGLVQEFQFGMNWSEYSRFVGDIFGAPLAIEALLAFFLESTFIGVWIFGWDKVSKGVHLASIWLVAIASNISALWILIANSFMQHPVGFIEENGRAVMNNFVALITNPYVINQFLHTVTSGFTTAAFFVLGISLYHLVRKQDNELFRKSFNIASIVGFIAILGVIGVGDAQGKYLFKVQPMKMAAAEALYRADDPAGLSVLTIMDEDDLTTSVDIRIPRLLSFLAYNKFDGRVEGITDLQQYLSEKYGPGDYVPSIFASYWSFRIMVGAGFLMLFLVLVALFFVITRRQLPTEIRFRKFKFRFGQFFPLIVILPYTATTTGWILTEMGRQPWIVYGVLKTADAVSPLLTPGMVLTSLIGFLLVYCALMITTIYLLLKNAKAGSETANTQQTLETAY
jgi:cytochrome bd ubiquinol oxidase subunit I